MIAAKIKKDLTKILEELKLPVGNLVLEHPLRQAQGKQDHGDYSTNIAMVLFSQKKNKVASPLDLAQQITSAFRSAGLPDYVTKIKVEKPGFINLWLKKKVLVKEIGKVLEEKESYGLIKSGKTKIMVEFAHPNTHKQFHIGHLRNICLGESLSRILAANGNKVVRANYQGDIGLHVAKCLWALGKSKRATPKSLDNKIAWLAKAYVKGNQAYEENEKAKKAIQELNQKIYGQDKQTKELWRKTRGWSLQYFDMIYQRLGVKFDRLYFESEVAEPGKQIVLKNKKMFPKSEGAVIFPGEKYGLHTRVFINQAGLPTYEAKDMALAKLQFKEFNPQKIIHVVGPEQKAYFSVVFEALKQIMPASAKREYHLAYGWVRLKQGKMASRTGQTVLAEWLLDEVKKRLRKKFKMTNQVAEAVAVGAVKYSLLKFNPISEIAFDIEESINLEGNSGPYLQYTYARCQSVLKKRQSDKEPKSHSRFNFDPLVLGDSVSEEGRAVLRMFYKFPEVVREAGENYAPNLIGNFLFDLAQAYNLFYNRQPILKAEPQKLVEFRLALTAAVSQIIKNGLDLLGVETVEKM